MSRKKETLEKINYEVIYNAAKVHGCWIHIKTEEESTAQSTYFKNDKSNIDVYDSLQNYFATKSTPEQKEKAARFLTIQVWQICGYKSILNLIEVDNLNTKNL
jgi:hypothetical protein